MTIKTDPAFIEKLSHRKRSNVTYANFAKNSGRDNLMYHLSDGYNLNAKKDEETFMDNYLAFRLAQKKHEYVNLQQMIV